ALRVGAQRRGAASAEAVLEDEIEQAQVVGLVPFHGSGVDARHVPPDEFRGELLLQERVRGVGARDHADVRARALVSGACGGDAGEGDPGHVRDHDVTTSTRAEIFSLRTSAGQKPMISVAFGLPAANPVTPGGPLVTRGASSMPSRSTFARSVPLTPMRRTTSLASRASAPAIPAWQTFAPRNSTSFS